MPDRRNFTKPLNWALACALDLAGYFLLRCFRMLSGDRELSEQMDPERVLVIRTDGIGDLIVTIPLFNALVKRYPNARIDCLVREKTEALCGMIPAIHRTIASRSRFEDIRRVWALRQEKYSIIIDPRPDGYLFNHVLALLGGGERRAGFAMKGGGFLLTDVVAYWEDKHMVQLMLDIAQHLGTSDPDPLIALDTCARAGVASARSGTLTIGLNPFAAHPFIWTDAAFTLLCQRLQRKYPHARIVFIGTGQFRDRIETLRSAAAVPAISHAGRTGLEQLVQLIQGFDLLITVDSGPRHIANAVGTPVVVLRNGANANVLWGNYAEKEQVLNHSVPCSPCGRACCPDEERICMTGISVDDVMRAVDTIIGNR